MRSPIGKNEKTGKVTQWISYKSLINKKIKVKKKSKMFNPIVIPIGNKDGGN